MDEAWRSMVASVCRDAFFGGWKARDEGEGGPITSDESIEKEFQIWVDANWKKVIGAEF